MNKTIKLFFSYVILAGIATIVDMSLLYLLTESGIFYLISATISYSAGMITNYSLNKKFNFKDKDKKIVKQFGKFIFIALIGLVINQVILYILVEKFSVWYIEAKIVSLIIVMFWSFYGHKKVTFNENSIIERFSS